MTKGRVSIVIPARQEAYLRPTVVELLKQARGDVEIIAVADGDWPNPALPDDPRLKTVHFGAPKGLRPAINAGMAIATGEYLMKIDGHCSVSEGFDLTLAQACGERDVCVPAKHSLNVEDWTMFRDPWHYYRLLWPWPSDGSFVGLQDRNYDSDYNAPREHIRVDDILSFQGSAWLLRRAYWDRLLPLGMDSRYYMAAEPIEIGVRSWLSGGRCRIVKDASYGHLWKGRSHKRQFKRIKRLWNEATLWTTRYWMTNQWQERVHDFAWLIHKFGPLPGWPEDWQAEAARRFA